MNAAHATDFETTNNATAGHNYIHNFAHGVAFDLRTRAVHRNGFPKVQCPAAVAASDAVAGQLFGLEVRPAAGEVHLYSACNTTGGTELVHRGLVAAGLDPSVLYHLAVSMSAPRSVVEISRTPSLRPLPAPFVRGYSAPDAFSLETYQGEVRATLSSGNGSYQQLVDACPITGKCMLRLRIVNADNGNAEFRAGFIAGESAMSQAKATCKVNEEDGKGETHNHIDNFAHGIAFNASTWTIERHGHSPVRVDLPDAPEPGAAGIVGRWLGIQLCRSTGELRFFSSDTTDGQGPLIHRGLVASGLPSTVSYHPALAMIRPGNTVSLQRVDGDGDGDGEYPPRPAFLDGFRNPGAFTVEERGRDSVLVLKGADAGVYEQLVASQRITRDCTIDFTITDGTAGNENGGKYPDMYVGFIAAAAATWKDKDGHNNIHCFAHGIAFHPSTWTLYHGRKQIRCPGPPDGGIVGRRCALELNHRTREVNLCWSDTTDGAGDLVHRGVVAMGVDPTVAYKPAVAMKHAGNKILLRVRA